MDYAGGQLLVDPKKLALDGLGAGAEILGFGAGFYLERKFVNFTTDVDLKTKIARFLSGGLIYIFLFNSLQGVLKLFLSAEAARIISSFMCVFFIIFLYPLIFSAVEKRHAAQENPENKDGILLRVKEGRNLG